MSGVRYGERSCDPFVLLLDSYSSSHSPVIPLTFRPHPSSFILHPSSLILVSSACLRLRPTTGLAPEDAGRSAALHGRRAAGRRRHGRLQPGRLQEPRVPMRGDALPGPRRRAEGPARRGGRLAGDRRHVPPANGDRAISAAKAPRTAVPRRWPSGWPNWIRPSLCSAKANWGRNIRSGSTNSCRRSARPRSGSPSLAIRTV